MLSHAIEVLGWTLLHFVWQGFAAVVLLAALLLMMRRASAHARYLSACGVFALMTLAPLVTGWWLSTQPRNIVEATEAEPRRVGRVLETHQTIASDVVGLDDSTHPTAIASVTPTATAERLDLGRTSPSIVADAASVGSRTQAASATPSETQPSWLEAKRSLMERHLDWIVAVWLLGVTVLSLRLFAGWLSVQRLRRRSSQPASDSWQALLRRSAERLRVTRPVKLVESALVEVPTVIGWLSPMILLPASAMTGLTTEQLEALLAHELAHVRRHDYLVNLLQTVVETLLFYHPAVWWVSHRIRLEREHCCDDLAVQVCGDGLTYAKALVALEELRAPKLGLAMSSSGGSLLARVARLLGQAEQQRRPTGWVVGLLSLVLLAMAGALGAGLLTPPEKPTEGLPNDMQSATTESTDTDEETSGPTQRRGQETRAERGQTKSDSGQSKTEPELENDDQVAATVNGLKILEADVLEPFGKQLAVLRDQLSPTAFQKARRELLEQHLKRHIERQLLVQESDRTIWPEGRKEVDRAAKEQFDEHVEKLMRELKITDRKQLDQQLKNRGSSLTLIEADFLREQHASQFLGRKYHFGGWETGGDFIDQLWRQAKIKTTCDVAKGRGLSDELRDPQNQRIREALRSPAMTGYVEVPLHLILQSFAEDHRIVLKPDATAIPNWNALAQTPMTLDQDDEALGVVLDSMLEPLQLTYRVANGELLITTSEDLKRRGEKLPVFVTAAAEVLNTRIRNELRKPMDGAFHESRLVDVLLFFSDYHEIRIGPDLAAISNWREVAETPITVEYREDALGVVLNAILKPLRLRYRVHNGELLVTTFRSDQAVGSGDQPEKPTEGLPDKTEPKSKQTPRTDTSDPEMKKILAMCIREAAAALANGRLELALEQEHFIKPSADKPDGEVATSTATSRWIGEGPKWRVDYDGRMLRSVENWVVQKWLPLQWTAGFDGQQHYHWDRANKQIELGREFAMALQHSPARLFFGFTVADLEMLLAAPKTKTTAITHQGLKCIQVDAELVVQSKTQRFVFILCPEHGYLPLENRFYSDGQFVGETKFSDFYEPRAGVWAARKIQIKSPDPENPNMEKPLERIIHTVKRLDLGEAAKLQAEEFRIDPPAGTKRIEPEKSESPRRTQAMNEVQRALLAVLRQRAENDVNIRYAKKSAEVAKAEWDKMLEANRKVPGSIPNTEIERAKLQYEKGLLQIEQAEQEHRLHQLELELALSKNAGDEADSEDRSIDLRWQKAKAQADLAQRYYENVLETNRRVPGTVPDAQVANAKKADETAKAQLERPQLEFQIVAQLKNVTEVAFRDTPLTDVAIFFSDFHNIPVELDASAKKFADSPVTLTMDDTDLAEALTMALHPFPLSYCIDEGRLLIASPEEIQRRGHKPARRFAVELAELKQADATLPWEMLLRSEGVDDPVALAKTVVPKLNALLNHRNENIQRLAARSLTEFGQLTRFGPLVTPDRPALEKLTKSKNPRVARAAWMVLVSIGQSDFSTLPLFLAELDANAAFGETFFVLFGRFDAPVWRELAKAFPKSSPRVRASIAGCTRLHQTESRAVALLAVADADAVVRRSVLQSYRPQERSDEWLTSLQARLGDSALDIRVIAAGQLLSSGHSVNEAVELLLSELVQADKERVIAAMRHFLQVQPEAIRAVVDALDAPTRSKDAARSREAWRVLMFLNLIGGRNNPNVVPWGPTRAGLRTRLSIVPSKLEAPPYQASLGEPIKLKLELKNFGEQPVEYDAQQAAVNQPLIVFDDEMRSVKHIGPQVSTTGSKRTIKPGETHVLVEQLELTAQYDLKSPGKYHIQWTQGSRAIAPDDAKTPFVPNSNVLALEIQKTEGNEDRTDKNGNDAAKSERPSPKVQGEILSANLDNGLVTISLGEGDGIKTRTKFKVRRHSSPDDPSSPTVEKGTIEIVRLIDQQTSEARILGLIQNDGPAKGDRVVQLDETKEPNDEPPRTPAAKRNSVRGQLQDRVTLSMENAPLRRVIEHIGEAAKIAVRLDSDALEEEGVDTDTPVSISVYGISTASALQLLLQPIQLGYFIENETLVVTTADCLAKTPVEEPLDLGKTLADEAKMSLLKDAIQTFVEPKGWDVAGGLGSIRFHATREEFVVRHVPFIQHRVDRFLTHFVPRPISPEMQRLRKLLAQRFTLELGEVTLLDAAHKIAMAAGANVLLDADGLRTARVRSDRRVTLNHKDTPLRDILDGLCKPLKLRFQIRNEVLQITDQKTAQGGFVAVLYPINTPADDLANRLQKSIRPESWKSAGGQGTIEPHLPTNSLIIRQHEDVHDEIAEFLAKLNPGVGAATPPEWPPIGAGNGAFAPAVKPATQLKGQIRWIDQTHGLVWINLGQTDGAARRMRFQVREKADPKNGNQPQAVKGKIEVSRVIDGHTSEARIILDDQNNAVAKGDEIVQLFETTQPNDAPIEGQRKLPPPKGEIYDAASPGIDRIKPNRESGAVSGAISGIRRERDPKLFGQFIGRVRLKTEKPLPDLEKLVVPAGKVLDESLVFSKDGGLANVFVYLQKPTFPIEPPPSNRPPKPFIMIAEGGKFWPHAAFVRVGRPVVFENRQTEVVNFHFNPLKNVAFNVVAKAQDQIKLQALRNSENFPFAVKSAIQPWMQAHLLTLDHPFAAVTDEEGRFTIDGLPPGDHEFHVWHERVGYLEKKLPVTIKLGEGSRSELEYTPDRLKLTEADVFAWGKRLLSAQRIPQAIVPPPAVQQPKAADAQATVPQGANESLPKDSGERGGVSPPVPSKVNAESTPNNRGADAAPLANGADDAVPLATKVEPDDQPRTKSIERGIAYLKSRQAESGLWPEGPIGTLYDGGVSSLCVLALLQSGTKPEEAIVQKALASLRKIKPNKIYTVALQTMVFCAASPKEDAELIRRNVAWIEKAQVSDGQTRGAWSYGLNDGGRGDGSCSRFAVLGLNAAKKAGFDVQAETWRRVSDYYLTTQTAEGGWSYASQGPPSLSMTSAAVGSLATAHRYLPRDEQAPLREAAIRKPAGYLEQGIPSLKLGTGIGGTLYTAHCLERAGHISGIIHFGKLDWKAELSKQLLGLQSADGSWKGSSAGENNEFIATSLALLVLTGTPEPPMK